MLIEIDSFKKDFHGLLKIIRAFMTENLSSHILTIRQKKKRV